MLNSSSIYRAAQITCDACDGWGFEFPDVLHNHAIDKPTPMQRCPKCLGTGRLKGKMINKEINDKDNKK